MDVWYPIQVKQRDKAGRSDIDALEAVMSRMDRTKGFFVSFAFRSDALHEIDALPKVGKGRYSVDRAGDPGRTLGCEAGLECRRIYANRN